MSRQVAPDLSALIAACIVSDDRQTAVPELKSRLATIARTDETAVPLLRALEHLLDGVLADNVPDAAQAMGIVAESVRGLQADRDGSPAQSVAEHRLDLIERIDLMASGVVDVDLDSSASASSSAEPPLLTEREDGSRVELGRFDEPSATEAGSAPETTGEEPRTVAAIVEAIDAVVLRLARQLETVRVRTDAGQASEAQRTLGELSETVRELQDLKDALARWSKESAALLSGGRSE